MFGIMLTTAWTVLHLYVVGRACSVPWIVRWLPRAYLIGAGAVLWASFPLVRYAEHAGSGPASRTLELLGMTWLAVLFLTAMALLAADVGTGFGFLFRRQAPALRGLGLVVGGGLSLLALVQGLRPPVVRPYEVGLAGLPAERDGTVLIALSDLHLGSLLGRQWLDARVNQVLAESPDLIVLLGDIFEGHGEPRAELVSDLRRLHAPLGVWGVTGNHESHGGNGVGGRALADAGVRLLRNGWAEPCPGLVLAGVDYAGRRRDAGAPRDTITPALANRPPGASVLLTHAPELAERAAAAGAGLMLCGHTHGGQVWPFCYLVRRRYPLLAGRYEVPGMPVIVCRGTGTWGPRMRLWHAGEILRITLRSRAGHGTAAEREGNMP